jgi:hypothetical protein
MAKRIQFADFSLDDVRQINNLLLRDLAATARESRVGFGSKVGKDHVEGGWTRGGDHVKGGWTRGAAAFEPFTPVEIPARQGTAAKE